MKVRYLNRVRPDTGAEELLVRPDGKQLRVETVIVRIRSTTSRRQIAVRILPPYGLGAELGVGTGADEHEIGVEADELAREAEKHGDRSSHR